jgi:hypothetical protein
MKQGTHAVDCTQIRRECPQIGSACHDQDDRIYPQGPVERFNAPVPTISDTAIDVMSTGQYLDGGFSSTIGYQPQANLEETVERAFHWFKLRGKC